MPITIKTDEIKVRKESGGYKSINAVSESTTDEQIRAINAAGTSNVTKINTKAAEVTSQLASAGELEDMIADAFDPNTNYSAGNYVIQTDNDVNKLYKFTADHEAGDWTDADVVETKIGTEVDELKGALSDAGFFLTVAYDGIWDVGALNSSGQERSTSGWIRTRNYFKVNSDIVHVVLALGTYTNLLYRVIEYSAESTDSFVINNSFGSNAGLGPHDISLTTGNYIRISVGPASGSPDIVDSNDGDVLVSDMSYETTLDLTTDKTLTLPNRPADANVTRNAIKNPFEKTIYMEWQTGKISSTTGNNSQSTSTVYIRNEYRYKIEKSKIHLTVPTDMTVELFSYNGQTGTFIEQIGTYTQDSDLVVTPGIYVRMVAYNTDLSDITLSAGYNVKISYLESAQEFFDKVNKYRLSDYSCLSMFETIGIIGDSWASGSIHTPNGFVDTVYNMSWGQILARKMSITVTNYSKGGLTTGAWLANTEKGLPALLADSVKNAYLLNLGINDSTAIRQGTETLGTIADVNISDYTQNPDTFYGNYGRIVGNIKAHAPKAIIIMLSVARPGERNMDEHIKAIAEKYGIPYINLENDSYFISGYFFGSIYDGHMSAYGYSGMANAIERLIQKYIIENRSQFTYYDGLTT